MERCPTQDQLRQWLAGLASDADSLAIENHVQSCAEICQPLLDRMSGFEDEPGGASRRGRATDETSATRDQDHGTPPTVEPPLRQPGHLRKFGRFDILEVIGKGGFGTVYRAYDPQLEREVALKIPSKGLLQGADERKRFLREARAAATLQNANICQVYEAGELDGRQYIVMALIDGQPLAKVIARGRPLAERAAASTARKLALALEEAHQAGIIHRDLKPTNIMIDRRGQPVVMDFGLARRSDPNEATLTQIGAVLGTPAYMAPEQALSQHDDIGPATDIFALGVVLYEMLTLRRPYAGGTAALVGAAAAVQPKPPSALRSGLDPRLDAICLKAIARNPADRYRSMREFADALREFLKGADAKQTETPPLMETQELNALFSGLDARLSNIAKRQRVPWWQWTAAILVVAGIVFLGWFLFPRAPSTVMVRIGIDPALLTDSSLTFFLDQREITAQEAADELPLAVGDHDLVVKRELKIIKHYRFHVSATPDPSGSDSAQSGNQLVVLTEINDGPDPVVELPVPVAYLTFDDQQADAAAAGECTGST